MLYSRFKGGVPTRRAIGDVRKMTVEQARTIARDWHALIAKGIDPKAEQKRQRREQQARQACTFGAVAKEFIEVHLSRNAPRPSFRAGDPAPAIAGLGRPSHHRDQSPRRGAADREHRGHGQASISPHRVRARPLDL